MSLFAIMINFQVSLCDVKSKGQAGVILKEHCWWFEYFQTQASKYHVSIQPGTLGELKDYH